VLSNQLGRVSAQREELAGENQQLRDELAQLKKRVASLEEQLKEKDKEIASLKEVKPKLMEKPALPKKLDVSPVGSPK